MLTKGDYRSQPVESPLSGTLYLLQGHTDRDVQKQRNKATKKQRDAVKSDYRPQPVESPLSGTHFTCCRDIQTGTYRNKETNQERNKEMLSRVATDHSQSSPLSLGHTLPVARTYRHGRTETKKQSKEETKRCCQGWL